MKLKHIKVNPSDLCNLRCQFCPRGNPDVYPNNNEHMTMDTFRVILNHLKGIEGPFHFEMVGHGEPTIARHFQQMSQELHAAKQRYPNMITRIVSNGAKFDKFSNEIEMYDEVVYDVYTDSEDEYWDQIAKWRHLNILSINMINFAGKLRFAWNGRGDVRPSEMLLNNRGNKFEIPLIGNLNPPNHGDCVRPTEDITINHNGDYILCCEDWDNIKLGNVHDQNFVEYYDSEHFKGYRDQLAKGIRAGQCEGCSYPGNNWHYGNKPWLQEPSDDWKKNIEERMEKIRALPDFPVDIKVER